MKSQKGITMISLVIYVASFLVVAGIVGAITTYFYNNMQILNSSSSSSVEYNKFNVYFLKQMKTPNASIASSKTDGVNYEGNYITISTTNGDNKFTYIGGMIYFNKIKLCENVEKFDISIQPEVSVTITLQISNKQYKTKYALQK